MIASLRGTVIELEGNLAVIDVHGVGYQVFCTQAAAATLEINTEIKIVTYTEVREDAIRIFGFESKLEKQTFLLLTLVKGIGPKSALDVLSRIDAKTLLKIIAGGDVSKLKAVKGIGQKTAERVVVELKDKVAQFVMEQYAERAGHGAEIENSPKAALESPAAIIFEDAKLALQALGFARRDVEEVMRTIQNQTAQNQGVQFKDSGAIVREGLKLL